MMRIDSENKLFLSAVSSSKPSMNIRMYTGEILLSKEVKCFLRSEVCELGVSGMCLSMGRQPVTRV